jgi:hypothetical protein
MYNYFLMTWFHAFFRDEKMHRTSKKEGNMREA